MASVKKVTPSVTNTNKDKDQLIAEAAYFKAAQRGFQSGNEQNDWLDAEKEVEQMLQKLSKKSSKAA